MAITTLKIWGNNLDLPNAKKWCDHYLSGCYNFIYINTTHMGTAEKKMAVISAQDILLGGIGAPNGVGKHFSIPEGTLRLYGVKIKDTDKAIEEWAKKLKEKCEKEAQAAKPVAPPAAPKVPSAPVAFDAPMPAFSDDVETIHKYSYFFGLDDLSVKSRSLEDTSCFISEDIEVGELREGEYVQLHAEYDAGEHTSVEFYLLSAGASEPILPHNETVIEGEKIFAGFRTRFPLTEGEPVTIRRNGIETTQTLEEAMSMTDGLYTVSYTPIDPHSKRFLGSAIKVKVVLRLYDKTMPAPHVRRIEIRKYGGNALWKESI